ncbi:MAG: hypothetical protein OCC49_14750 [Fibrobacterales bacterium]
MRMIFILMFTVVLFSCENSTSGPVTLKEDAMIGNWYFYPKARQYLELSDRMIFKNNKKMIMEIDYQEESAFWYCDYNLSGDINTGSLVLTVDSVVDNLVDCDESIGSYDFERYKATCSTEIRKSDLVFTFQIDSFQDSLLVYSTKESGKIDTMYRY